MFGMEPFQPIDQINKEIENQGSNSKSNIIDSMMFQQINNSVPIRQQQSPMRSENLPYTLARQSYAFENSNDVSILPHMPYTGNLLEHSEVRVSNLTQAPNASQGWHHGGQAQI